MSNPNYPPGEGKSFVAFEAGQNLDRVMAKLFQMQKEGQVLQGSSQDYTPKELAELVLQAGEAIKKLMQKPLEIAKLTDQDFENMPEINRLTRMGNFRQAVIGSLKRVLREGEGILSPMGESTYQFLTQTGPFSSEKK